MDEALRYNMSNDRRAISVFRDLSRLVKEHGCAAKPKAVRAAVAKIFIYSSWDEMVSLFGFGDVGPEDNALPPATLRRRRQVQVEAISSLGFSFEISDAIISKLRPTDRSGKTNFEGIEQLRYNTIGDYHPNRFQDMWSEISLPSDFWEIESALRAWSSDRPMAASDKELCLRSGGENETDVEYIFDLIEEVGFMIDAKSVAQEYSKLPVVPDLLREIPEPYSKVSYVYFGANAFPSPYRDVGIEGAYVRYHYGTRTEINGLPDSVEVRVVCSLPFEAGSDWVDGGPMYIDGLMNLRDHLRGVLLSVEATSEDIMASSIAYFRRRGINQEKYGGAIVEWADYLDAPCTAALHAVKMTADKGTAIFDAPSTNASYSTSSRVYRAVTEAKFLATAANYDDRYPIVRFLGRRPPSETTETEYLERHVNVSIPSDRHYLEGMCHDVQGFDSETAIQYLDDLLIVFQHTDIGSQMSPKAHAFAIHTLMRWIADFELLEHQDQATFARHRAVLVNHIDSLLSLKAHHGERSTPLAWLGARILGLEDRASTAFDRLRNEIGDPIGRVIVPLSTHLDEWMEYIANGRVCKPMDYFMRMPWDETELAGLRSAWDHWFVPSMIKVSA